MYDRSTIISGDNARPVIASSYEAIAAALCNAQVIDTGIAELLISRLANTQKVAFLRIHHFIAGILRFHHFELSILMRRASPLAKLQRKKCLVGVSASTGYSYRTVPANSLLRLK